MACFSIAWIVALVVRLVIIVAVIAICNLLIPWLFAKIGAPADGGIIWQVVRIVLWAIVAIFCVYALGDLLGCAFSGGLHLLR